MKLKINSEVAKARASIDSDHYFITFLISYRHFKGKDRCTLKLCGVDHQTEYYYEWMNCILNETTDLEISISPEISSKDDDIETIYRSLDMKMKLRIYQRLKDELGALIEEDKLD